MKYWKKTIFQYSNDFSNIPNKTEEFRMHFGLSNNLWTETQTNTKKDLTTEALDLGNFSILTAN